MFTGLIEEVGTLRAIRGGVLEIAAKTVLDGTRVGDSIAVNGACLTVTSLSGAGFTADATPETLRRTALGALPQNAPVNLERAMRASGRLDGHIVQGHVDGVGVLRAKKPEGNSVRLIFDAPQDLLPFFAEKGAVAVDGVSLTIAGLTETGFWVAMIPHTGQKTTLLSLRAGARVNLETDVLAKYVARMLSFSGRSAPRPPSAEDGASPSSVSMAFLSQNGFV